MRGTRTRDALLRGAREVFERDGFVDAKITSITQAAGVAAGSFYTHFGSKDAIFEAVIDEIHEVTLHPGIEDAQTPQESISATNRAYLEHYDRNARLFVLMDQVALVDEHFRKVRQELSRSVAKRNARAIRRWQDDGLVDATLDPLTTAHALNAMTSRMAYTRFAGGLKVSNEVLAENLTRLWINALQLAKPRS
jgi:AcrR family transcriptional regulator